MADDSKKRGRPPLTPEQKALRTQKPSRAGISATKEGGYAAQKRYRANHPERIKEQKRKQNERLRGSTYEPKLRIPMENKPILERLLSETGLSISQLCLRAVEEKYGVALLKPIDSSEPE